MRALPLAALCVAFPLAYAHAAALELVADPAAASGPVAEVDIKDMAFATPELTVKAGSTVRWKNLDPIAHNVHFRGGPAKGWDKAQGPMLNENESYAIKFNDPGTYTYICTPHSMVMKGKVVVE